MPMEISLFIIMIYLYDYAGEPWKTQKWAREVMRKLYNAGPDGYCGDEDQGGRAWYVGAEESCRCL